MITLEFENYSHLSHLVAKGSPRSIDFLQIAMSHDYSLYEPSLEGIRPHALRDSDYEYGNIVAVPNEKREEFESEFQHDLK